MEAINCTTSQDLPVLADKFVEDDNKKCVLYSLDKDAEYVVPYMAGFVTKKILNTIQCGKCIEAILDVQGSTTTNCKYSLIQLKDNGGLIYPSSDVIRICKTSEQVFRSTIPKNGKSLNSKSFIISNQVSMVLNRIQSETSKPLFENLQQHSDGSVEYNHYANLIRCVADEYLRMKHFYAVKKIIDKSSNRKTFYNKLMLNTNQ